MQYINGFGCYRYILSLLVLFHHLRLWIPLADTVDWGTHAVLGFFLISGYMIAAILDKSYADKNRVIRFAVNRLLRLLPAHWAALLFLVFTFLIVPESMLGWGLGRGAVSPLESYSWLQWAGNIFLVGNVPLLTRKMLPAHCSQE